MTLHVTVAEITLWYFIVCSRIEPKVKIGKVWCSVACTWSLLFLRHLKRGFTLFASTGVSDYAGVLKQIGT